MKIAETIIKTLEIRIKADEIFDNNNLFDSGFGKCTDEIKSPEEEVEIFRNDQEQND